jgi:hypothetical protein
MLHYTINWIFFTLKFEGFTEAVEDLAAFSIALARYLVQGAEQEEQLPCFQIGGQLRRS